MDNNLLLLICFFHEIFEIKQMLNTLSTQRQSTIVTMAHNMLAKFDKYWGDVEQINEFLILAAILDPRYKLKLLRLCFSAVSTDPKFIERMCARSVDTLRSLFAFYNENAPGLPTKEQPPPPPSPNDGLDSFILAGLMTPESFEQGDVVRTELDAYLSDACEPYIRTVHFDVLTWWKLNVHKYPILSSIARDVLAIQVSTVASESAFSGGGRILDSFRSSLHPRMVEALMCARDWLSERAPIMTEECREEVENLESSESIVTGK